MQSSTEAPSAKKVRIGQPVRLATHGPVVASDGLGVVDHAVLQGLDHGPDAGQRRAQVVRDVARELALRLHALRDPGQQSVTSGVSWRGWGSSRGTFAGTPVSRVENHCWLAQWSKNSDRFR